MDEIIKLKIAGISSEVDDVKTFVFDKADLTYRAGQYLTFVTQHHQQEIRRSYSIASSPALHEPLSITVKRTENGIFSRRMVDYAKVGDILTTTGSAGFFVLPEDIENCETLFFFAAGSGIVPIFSLIKTALHEHPHLKLVLIYSNRSPEKTIFYSQLLTLKNSFSYRLDIEFLFSINPDLSNARLNKELLHRILAKYAHIPTRSRYYLCGPFGYMRNTFIALEEAHIPAENIKREHFNTERQVLMAVPDDKEAHTVTIGYKDNHYQFVTRYPDSILRAAKKQGISLPYSCETGRCGACAANCLSGDVWMANNEVLTDKELQKGLILTCVGFPVHGDVRLIID